MSKIAMFGLTIFTFTFMGMLVSTSSFAQTDLRFSSQHELFKPENYREWMYIGTALTPHDKNNGKAAFPEFHNVYITRTGWDWWKKSGKFAEGTVIVKELTSVGGNEAVSGKGYFQGDFSGIAVMVKDKKRFPDKPGNWGFFFFEDDALPSVKNAAINDANCAQCHTDHAKQDMVFTQHYPILEKSITPPKNNGMVPASKTK